MFNLAFLTRYLLNKCMDSDQTYTETLLGGDLELIRFWHLDLIFKVTSLLIMLKLAFLMQYVLNGWMDYDETYAEILLGGDLQLI